MPVKLNSSGGGSVTIDVPSTASAYTLTAPAATATLITTGSTGQVIPKAALPTGSVLQVVSAAYSTEVSRTSSTWATSNLTASITPTSSSSKVLILVNLGDCSASNVGSGGIRIQLQRNGSVVGANFNNQLSYQDPTSYSIVGGGFSYLDSPASTSSLTYTVFYAAQNGTVSLFRDGTQGSIILMEIAA